MNHDILRHALKQASEEMGFYVEEIHDSGVPEMSLKTTYKYVHFHQATPEIWLCHENGFDTMIATLNKMRGSCEWYVTTTETGGTIEGIRRLIRYLRDIKDFLDQLNAGGKK